ncbi:hepatocyte growth factor receptor-like [Amphiura filiformis]|uniref:hepatocyte growth factor receptor-like n=1 Tax=Amphiura filiformis TaxID=82378 RepID=UPI003B2286AC
MLLLNIFPPAILLFVTFQTTVSLDAGLSAYELASYSVPTDCEYLCDPIFNHFVIHKTTGDVYLGASNNVVHLNPSYQEIKRVPTFIECTNDIDREDCINHNKVLIIHYDTDDEKLITCGNYDSGKCQIRDPNDIEVSMLADQQVAAPGNLSTVYTIAPAPDSTSNGVGEMLYVGATDPVVQDITFFSRRRLSDESILSIPRDNGLAFAVTNFQVDFKDVFDFNGFTYFVTTQYFDRVRSSGMQYTNVLSKINRVCHDSTDLDSRTEVVIECTNNGENYNLIQAVHLTTVGLDLADSLGVPTNEQVLIGLFAKSVDPTDFTADNRSALCIFRLNDIESMFLRAIAACLESTDRGDGTLYINGQNCGIAIDPSTYNTTQFADQQKCNALNYALPRGKLTESVQSTAIIEWSSTLVSSIITTIEEEHTIAFIGTSTGQLTKYHLRGGETSRMYETVSLGSPVLRDDHLQTTEDGKQHLTVLTEQKIFKLRVENCGYYTTCDDCIGATEEDGDPYCGWCSLTRTCTRKTDCLLPDVSNRWLSYNEAQCLEISSVTMVTPFDSQPYTVPQEITVTVEQLPDLAPSTDYECVFDYGDTHSLSSMATKSGNDLVCMTPPTNDLPEIPDGRDHITTLLSIRSTETGVKFVDTNHTFFECATHERCLDCARSVWGCVWCVYGDVCSHDKNLCPDDTDNTLIAGVEHHVPGPRQGSDECAQLEMPDEEVLLAVGPEREIDITVFNLPDVNRVPVDNYLCILYIEGTEVEIPAVRDTVNTDLVRCQGTNYRYYWYRPRRGFGTIISVMVAGRPCDFMDKDMYEMSQRLSCITSMSEAVVTGDVLITVTGIDNTDQMNEPGTNFAYKDPGVLVFSPLFGPEAGGTKLKINGTSLVTGRYMEILIGNATCGLESTAADDTQLTCSTGTSVAGYKAQVKMTYDGAERTSKDEYEYRKNPVINKVQPNEAFKAGGRVLRVTGNNLDAVQTPQVRISIGGKEYTMKCNVINDNAIQMDCPSPAVNLPARTRRQADETVSDEGVIATLGFIMDGVTDLRDWSQNPQNNFTFEYFENPNYDKEFSKEVYVNEDDEFLAIEGERLNLASTESDVQVWVGQYPCEVVNLGLNVLSCQLPVELINNADIDVSIITLNVTIIQGNLIFENIGQVKFIRAEPPVNGYSEDGQWKLILISLVTLIVLFGVIIVLIHIWYTRRRQQIIAQATIQVIESLRRLHQEAERGLNEATSGQAVKLSNNVTVDLNDMQIQYSQLTFKNPLGKGEFGKVLLATLALPNSTKNVAVKTVKGDTDASFTLKFLEEALIMKDFDHPNVLGLIGLTFDPNGSPIVVLPYMKHGDLRSLLLKAKDSHEIGVEKMLSFAHDAAKGMTYLSEHKFVHRDLAARNCMIDEELVLRIADFGLSRDMNESDYYQSGDRKAKLPVKWMAPESLAKRLYSVKSDVWSYAIMLWEMFSRGKKPYQGVANRDVYHYITQGNRLSCPTECPSEIYMIMKRCWEHNARERPSFRDIAVAIQSIKDSSVLYSTPTHPTVDGNTNGDNEPSYETTITTSGNQYMDLLPERKSSTDYVVQNSAPTYPAVDGNTVNGDNELSYETTITASDNQYMDLLPERKSSTDYVAQNSAPTYPAVDGNTVNSDNEPTYETTITASDNQYMDLLPERKSSTAYVVQTMPSDEVSRSTSQYYEVPMNTLSGSQSDYEVQVDPFAASQPNDHINMESEAKL